MVGIGDYYLGDQTTLKGRVVLQDYSTFLPPTEAADQLALEAFFLSISRLFPSICQSMIG